MNEYYEKRKERLVHPDIETKKDFRNELREITQEIVLSGLAKTDFFENAVFMGGTALRIIHKLNRYSEDLDFNFINEDKNFKWEKYNSELKKYGEKYGCNFTFKKDSNDSRNTKSIMLKDENLGIEIKNENIVDVEWTKKKAGNYEKVKIRLDVSYQVGKFNVEKRSINFPDNYKINVFDISSLYAGKLNAILTRRDRYGNDIDEGRDWYDFKWLANKKIEPNYNYLFDKLEKDINYKDKNVIRNIDWLSEELINRAKKMEYNKINDDIFGFTTRKHKIELDFDKTKAIIKLLGNNCYMLKKDKI